MTKSPTKTTKRDDRKRSRNTERKELDKRRKRSIANVGQIQEGCEVVTELIRGVQRELSNQADQREMTVRQITINLLQISLTIFSGDPRKWREFQSNFEAAVHKQDFPAELLVFMPERKSFKSRIWIQYRSRKLLHY